MRINKLLVIILILSMTIPVISYAINIENGDKEFLTCESKEVSKGEKVVLNLNLDLIQYENFEFTLTSNTNLGNVSTETEGVEVSYPETIITLTVVEKQENENNEDTEIKNENNEGSQTGDKNNEQMNMEQNIETKATTTSQSQTQSFSSAGSLSSNLSSNVETNTYNGESNNYLSSLEISNYNINPVFTKTNTTYFIEVANDCTSLSVNAEAEDTNAIVTIYGDDDLQEGENKILISVTAENGEVKMYRLYVTRTSN